MSAPRRARRRHAASGMTLVEAIVALTVVMTSLGAIASVVRSSTGLSNVLARSGDLREKARRVSDTVGRELRWADASTFLESEHNGSSQVQFRTPDAMVDGVVTWSTTITYAIEPSNVDSNHDGVLNEGALVRSQDGIAVVISNDVPLGGFTVEVAGRSVALALTLQSSGKDGAVARATSAVELFLRNEEE